jgi:Coenzyme F420-dependent N5,N10-methylene tetrahydromethanopterin reductase and related flavin-dependent oxidoreductases
VVDLSVLNVGIGFDWRGANLQAMARIARGAEEFGYDVVWVPEAWGVEAFSSIAHILTITGRVKVGAGIVNVYSRSATLIGMGSVTLNQIAPERFILGLGVSGRGLIERWHGLKFTDPLTRVVEYLEVIRKTASGERVDYAGKHLNLGGFRLFTQPLTKPLEVYLAALGDRSLKLAAEHFDGSILTMYPASKLNHALNITTSLNPNKRVYLFQPVALNTINNTPEGMRQIVRTIVFYVASMGDYYHRNLSRLGFESVVEKIRVEYGAGRRDEAIKAAEPLVDELALVGAPREVAEKLEAYPKQVTPVLMFKAENPEDVDIALKTMGALSEELRALKGR